MFLQNNYINEAENRKQVLKLFSAVVIIIYVQ